MLSLPSLLNVGMDFLIKLWNDATTAIVKFVKNTIFYVTPIISVVSLILAYSLFYDVQPWFEIFRGVGYTLLSSSFFAAILKSSQFSKIFQDQLREVLYSNENLSKRKDISEIWDKVTTALCEQKFQIISSQLHKRIKEHYLPIDHEFYYKEFRSSIEITHHKEFGYVEVVEETTMTLISAHLKEIVIPFSVKIYKDSTDYDITSYELIEFKVNGISLDRKNIKMADNKTELLITGEFSVKEKKSYSISRREKKVYMLKHNTLRVQHANWLYKNAEITVRYPMDLNINLIPMGLTNKFTPEKVSINGIMKLTAKFTGLMFKNQGFILHITKK